MGKLTGESGRNRLQEETDDIPARTVAKVRLRPPEREGGRSREESGQRERERGGAEQAWGRSRV